LQRALTIGAGVLRSADSLAATRDVVDEVGAAADALDPTRDALEVRNLVAVARALLRAATFREESRGAHTRSDFPVSRDELRARIVLEG
jgi:L-aspartate oxidase